MNSLLAVINELLDQLGKAVINVPYAFWVFPHCPLHMGPLASRNAVCVFPARVFGFAMVGTTFLQDEECCGDSEGVTRLVTPVLNTIVMRRYPDGGLGVGSAV